jgi:hypothetical protein
MNNGVVTVPIEEYERLQRDSRALRAIRDTMTEYYMRKKLITSKVSEDHLHRLRRITLNIISELIHRKV